MNVCVLNLIALVFRLVKDIDLRQYSRQIEKELKDVENASIQDCIL